VGEVLSGGDLRGFTGIYGDLRGDCDEYAGDMLRGRVNI